MPVCCVRRGGGEGGGQQAGGPLAVVLGADMNSLPDSAAVAAVEAAEGPGGARLVRRAAGSEPSRQPPAGAPCPLSPLLTTRPRLLMDPSCVPRRAPAASQRVPKRPSDDSHPGARIPSRRPALVFLSQLGSSIRAQREGSAAQQRRKIEQRHCSALPYDEPAPTDPQRTPRRGSQGASTTSSSPPSQRRPSSRLLLPQQSRPPKAPQPRRLRPRCPCPCPRCWSSRTGPPSGTGARARSTRATTSRWSQTWWWRRGVAERRRSAEMQRRGCLIICCVLLLTRPRRPRAPPAGRRAPEPPRRGARRRCGQGAPPRSPP